MSKKMKKKGISPLIATVIVIGFTIVLAAGLIYWGTGIFNDLQDQTSKTSAISTLCSSDLANFEVTASRSGTTNNVDLLLDNTKNNADIYGVAVTLKDSATSVQTYIYGGGLADITTNGFPERPFQDVPAIGKFNTGSKTGLAGLTSALPKEVSVKLFVKTNPTDLNEAPSVCGNEFTAVVPGA